MENIPVTLSATLVLTPGNGVDLQALYELALARIGQGGAVTKDDQAGQVIVEITKQTTVE